MRVTSDPTSTVTTRIAAITATATIIVLITGREDGTPGKEGRAAASLLHPSLIATSCRLGL